MKLADIIVPDTIVACNMRVRVPPEPFKRILAQARIGVKTDTDSGSSPIRLTISLSALFTSVAYPRFSFSPEMLVRHLLYHGDCNEKQIRLHSGLSVARSHDGMCQSHRA